MQSAQYMKHTTLENPDITVRDERILDLAGIVEEVKQSEEWEAVKMNILEIGLAQGIEKGIEQGLEQGTAQTLVKNVESAMKHFKIDLSKACEGLGTSVKEYEEARKKLAAVGLQSTAGETVGNISRGIS